MKKLAILLATLLAVAVLVAAGNDGPSFKATLTGDAEVPPVATDTSGKATFHANEDETEIRYTLKVKDGIDILAVAGAHIHCAPAGSNGPVIAFLAGAHPGGLDGKLKVSATLTDANIINPATGCGATIAELLDAMAAGDTYVNVHSAANPGGEVRGQIG